MNATYSIRVDGHLDDHWSGWLEDLTVSRGGDGTSSLTAHAVDQARLHGLLARLCDIGATVLEVRCIDPTRSGTSCPVLEHPLRTERLTLRPATVEDADLTWVYRRPPSVDEWIWDCPPDLDAHRELFADEARLATTVVVQLGHHAAADIVGDLMLRREDASAQLEVAEQARGVQAELGWVLDPAHAGHGYAAEAVRELLRHCFEDLCLHRVSASCFLADDASWRLMELVGMRRETLAVRESLHRSGRWLDTVGYAVLADEWTRT